MPRLLARMKLALVTLLVFVSCRAPSPIEHSIAIELHRASAVEVAAILNELIEAAHAASMNRKFEGCILYRPGEFPDLRPPAPIARADRESNVVIVRVEAPEEEPRVRELIARLDVER